MVIKNYPLIECMCGASYPDPRDRKDSAIKHRKSKIHIKNLGFIMLYSQTELMNGTAKVGDPIPDRFITRNIYQSTKKGEL